MNNKIPVIYKYLDDRKNINYKLDENKEIAKISTVHNTMDIYSHVFKQIKSKIFNYYGEEVNAFYDALEKYDLSGKEVIIWGLAGCNCDALALYYKAIKVYVVDYNKPICDHESVEALSFDEAKNCNIKADFAFSYSSFEHDGLGRYGDPINPDGDIIAMQEARNKLKDNGILFLGVPLGTDCLYWNAHRVYGSIRLPFLLKGFQCIDVYSVYPIFNIDEEYPFDLPLGGYIQCLMVCRKIPFDYHLEPVLLQDEKTNAIDTNSSLILNNINKAILKNINAK